MSMNDILSSPNAFRAYKNTWNIANVKSNQNIVEKSVRRVTNLFFGLIRFGGNSAFFIPEIFFVSTLDPTFTLDEEATLLEEEDKDCIRELKVGDVIRIGVYRYSIDKIEPTHEEITDECMCTLVKENGCGLKISGDVNLRLGLKAAREEQLFLSFLKIIYPDDIILPEEDPERKTITIDTGSFTLSNEIVAALMQDWPNSKCTIILNGKRYAVEHCEDFPFEEGKTEMKVDESSYYDYLTINLTDGKRGQLVLDPFNTYEGTTHQFPLQFDQIKFGENINFRNKVYGVMKAVTVDWRKEYFLHHHTLEFYNTTGALRKLYLNPI